MSVNNSSFNNGAGGVSLSSSNSVNSFGGNSMSKASPARSNFGGNNSTFNRQERQERQTNFKVVIRVRPPLPRELSGDIPFQNVVAVDQREQCITVSENLEAVLDEDGNVPPGGGGAFTTHSFVFDYVYDQNCTQKKVYETTARTVVDSALQGYNATIFAYGQTGTGKTFTMEGFNREGSVEARGIIPRAIEQIFSHIQKFASPRMRFLVRASYLQIYNEQISDLLKPEQNNLTIREDKKRGVFVEGLSEWVVRSPAEIYGLMERGGAVRATGETKMNEASSRSHAVFIVIAEQSETVYVDANGNEMSPEEFQKFMHGRGVRREQELNKLEDHVRQSFKVGKLNLVDLAGSERVRLSGATGQRLEESKQINRSLSALGNVISALTDAKSRQHIPYRDSKLTRMLEDSLGGNCKTTMMAMISPAFEAMLETISTLKFANRAKNIRNEARVNEDLDQKSLLRKYERELKKLRAELEERSKNVVDKRRLLELDEQRRRAEADKMAAIRALEARSMEFMREKEEKKKLEQRIAMLMGQMIRGDGSGAAGAMNGNGANGMSEGMGTGSNSANGAVEPELQVMIKEQQDKLRKEYELKLAGLERERETIEEEKAQVDRYKQLLLKQRDIMIALTQRLVERDEQIMSLQDELDAYDRHHKELEEKLDEKTALLIKFQRISMEVNMQSPTKNEELSSALQMDNNGPVGESAKMPRKTAQATEIINTNNGGDLDDDASLSGKRSASNKLDRTQVINAVRYEFDNALRRMNVSELSGDVRDSLAGILDGVLDRLQENMPGFDGSVESVNPRLSMELEQLRLENTRLRTTNRQLEASKENRVSSDATATLQTRCDTLVKEREAVMTIMEHKIKVLVQSVSQAAVSLLQTAPSSLSQDFTKDLSALQRLVNASIAALKNAANADIAHTPTNPNPINYNPPPSKPPGSINSDYSAYNNPNQAPLGGPLRPVPHIPETSPYPNFNPSNSYHPSSSSLPVSSGGYSGINQTSNMLQNPANNITMRDKNNALSSSTNNTYNNGATNSSSSYNTNGGWGDKDTYFSAARKS